MYVLNKMKINKIDKNAIIVILKFNFVFLFYVTRLSWHSWERATMYSLNIPLQYRIGQYMKIKVFIQSLMIIDTIRNNFFF